MHPFKPLDESDYKPLYIQLADRIVEYIDDNNLPAGAPLPSQNEFAKIYGISHITVRHAMSRLTSDGILERIRGKGTFVANRRGIIEISGFQSIEQQLIQQGKAIESELIIVENAFPGEKVRNDLGIDSTTQTVRIRQLKRIEGSIFALESRHIPAEVFNLFSEEDFKTTSPLTVFNSNEKTRIGNIKYAIRASLLSEFEAQFMGLSEDHPALVQFGAYYDQKGKAVMSGRVTYLGHELELTYNVSIS